MLTKISLGLFYLRISLFKTGFCTAMYTDICISVINSTLNALGFEWLCQHFSRRELFGPVELRAEADHELSICSISSTGAMKSVELFVRVYLAHRMSSATFSANADTVLCGWPGELNGIAEASTTRSPFTPNTLALASTTASLSPIFSIAQVELACQMGCAADRMKSRIYASVETASPGAGDLRSSDDAGDSPALPSFSEVLERCDKYLSVSWVAQPVEIDYRCIRNRCAFDIYFTPQCRR
jgi:hypothetical protein